MEKTPTPVNGPHPNRCVGVRLLEKQDKDPGPEVGQTEKDDPKGGSD